MFPPHDEGIVCYLFQDAGKFPYEGERVGRKPRRQYKGYAPGGCKQFDSLLDAGAHDSPCASQPRGQGRESTARILRDDHGCNALELVPSGAAQNELAPAPVYRPHDPDAG